MNLKYNNKYRISSTRLPGWDYASEGYYYVTICTKDKICCLGDVVKGKIVLSETGKIAEKYWKEIPKHYPNTVLDIFQIMPNRLHGIVIIVETYHGTSLQIQREFKSNLSGTLSGIINKFKGAVKSFANKNIIQFSWQPNYYEHVIRNDRELAEIREYIQNNPLNWEMDEYCPKFI